MKKKIKIFCLVIAIIILFWCIISRGLSVLYSLGSQSKYVNECLFILDTLLPDVVSLIAYIVLLWYCLKLIRQSNG